MSEIKPAVPLFVSVDEASQLVGYCNHFTNVDLASKIQNEIMAATSPLETVKAIELNKPTIVSAPNAEAPAVHLSALQQAAVDDTAKILGADSEGGE